MPSRLARITVRASLRVAPLGLPGLTPSRELDILCDGLRPVARVLGWSKRRAHHYWQGTRRRCCV
jgi:hypothetical protein